jgi:transcriptional regulator with XRE-family HTH domain
MYFSKVFFEILSLENNNKGEKYMENRFDPKLFKVILGKKLRALRMRKKISQVQLAKELGFKSTGTISLVENGIKGLKVESILRAAKALDVHPIVLITPDEFSKDEIELVSLLFRFFDKRRTQTDRIEPTIERLRRFLNRFAQKPV